MWSSAQNHPVPTPSLPPVNPVPQHSSAPSHGADSTSAPQQTQQPGRGPNSVAVSLGGGPARAQAGSGIGREQQQQHGAGRSADTSKPVLSEAQPPARRAWLRGCGHPSPAGASPGATAARPSSLHTGTVGCRSLCLWCAGGTATGLPRPQGALPDSHTHHRLGQRTLPRPLSPQPHRGQLGPPHVPHEPLGSHLDPELQVRVGRPSPPSTAPRPTWESEAAPSSRRGSGFCPHTRMARGLREARCRAHLSARVCGDAPADGKGGSSRGQGPHSPELG